MIWFEYRIIMHSNFLAPDYYGFFSACGLEKGIIGQICRGAKGSPSSKCFYIPKFVIFSARWTHVIAPISTRGEVLNTTTNEENIVGAKSPTNRGI
jgi:hypothetical protein